MIVWKVPPHPVAQTWRRQIGPYFYVTIGPVLCPDLTRGVYFGEADNRRGRIVLLFFRILDRLMPVPG